MRGIPIPRTLSTMDSRVDFRELLGLILYFHRFSTFIHASIQTISIPWSFATVFPALFHIVFPDSPDYRAVHGRLGMVHGGSQQHGTHFNAGPALSWSAIQYSMH